MSSSCAKIRANRALRAVTLLKTPGALSKALAYQYMGEIARVQGDPKRALTLVKRALMEDPSLEGAKALLLGQLPVRSESYDGVAATLLAYSVTGRPLDTDRRYAQAELSASAAAVRAAMAKWIRPDGFASVTPYRFRQPAPALAS